MKKIPLYLWLFLVLVWGASQKITSSFREDDKAQKDTELAITYFEALDKPLDLSTLSWEEFYRVHHHQFSSLTNEELYQLYQELKRQDSLYIHSTN